MLTHDLADIIYSEEWLGDITELLKGSRASGKEVPHPL